MKSKCLFKVSAAGYIWSVRRECVGGDAVVYVVRKNRRLVGWPWGFDNLQEAYSRSVALAFEAMVEREAEGGTK